MAPSELSDRIARRLGSLWEASLRPDFGDYVRATYGVVIDQPPRFRCIYIGETEEGDARRAPMPGLLRHWWQADDQGVREINIPKMNWDTDPFFATPVILFYFEVDCIAIYETLGQRMACWRAGKIKTLDDRVELVEVHPVSI